MITFSGLARGCHVIELSQRQETILRIVKDEGPITGEHIAEKLNLTRATLRPDLAILTMSGFLDARPRVGYFYAGKSSNQLLGDYVRKLTVKEHKSVPVVCQEETSVYDAICTMFLEDVGTLFVVRNGGILTGVVSRKDLLKSTMGGQDLAQTPIGVIMTRMPNIVTCQLEDTLLEAATRLIYNQVDALPVVKESASGKGVEVVGRITKTTVTKVFVELGEDTPV
ncbi:helix-turn-helix transcriptional regulator [Marininema halotolerans]|uniref:CBS domain-containing protein n=1 Tax=Marininema halotolerans TaxID=1155944 RepID=A0A1I6SY77_9BACL|nr:helix-turn-helix transcriptional regulator [Marininema halotolerans]SFS81906.1 CBS domain-containing protein [Marininema halotolerans]